MKLYRRSSVIGVLIVALISLSYLAYLRSTSESSGLGDALANGGQESSALPGPSPDLSPPDAVLTVLAALRDNDSPRPDAGIDTAFHFASPANRMRTGPLMRFRQMVKQPMYAPLLEHQNAEILGIQVLGGQNCIVRVVLTADGQPPAFFDFMMTRQYVQPYDGCWMTDGVRRLDPSIIEPPQQGPPQPEPADPAAPTDGHI